MENEEKIKTISELYKEKSDILRELSDLNNPDYSFVIGRRGRGWGTYNDIFQYTNIETEFLSIIKKMTIEQYERTVKRIDLELEQILTQK